MGLSSYEGVGGFGTGTLLRVRCALLLAPGRNLGELVP